MNKLDPRNCVQYIKKQHYESNFYMKRKCIFKQNVNSYATTNMSQLCICILYAYHAHFKVQTFALHIKNVALLISEAEQILA